MSPGVKTMTTIAIIESADFVGRFRAQGRSPEIPESEDAYGWLVGSWQLDVRHYFTDVSTRNLKGETHFAWVLEGRAVQD
jgi:hypothetical protein